MQRLRNCCRGQPKASKVFKTQIGYMETFSGQLDVSVSAIRVLAKYLLHWKASIYRLVWIDVLVWLIAYYALNLSYRFLMNATQKEQFQNFVEQVAVWSAKIPVTFVLGFFVGNVVTRWWNIFNQIPSMSGQALGLAGNIYHGPDAIHLRSLIGRYLNLAWILALWRICGGLKLRMDTIRRLTVDCVDEVVIHEDASVTFATNDETDEFARITRRCLVPNAGPVPSSLAPLALLNRDPVVRRVYGQLVTPAEFAIFLRRARAAGGNYKPEWFLPLHWALAAVNTAAEKDCMRGKAFGATHGFVQDWAAKIRTLISYSNRQLPLVYTQVVIIAVYTVYITDVVSRQMLDPAIAIAHKSKGYYVDYLVPILGIVHIVFLLGWFKVALVLMDPLGNDEEDFPFSSIFNCNLEIARQQLGSDGDNWFPKRLMDAHVEEDENMAISEMQQIVEEYQTE